MHTLLIIANSTKPSTKEYESRAQYSPSNFTRPCIKAGLAMGFKVIQGVNRKYASEISCDLPIALYDEHSFRNPFAIWDNLIALRNALKTIRNNNVDFIHCNTPVGGMIGRISGRIAGVKRVVYTAHGFHFYKGAPFLNRTLLKWAELIMARWTDAIITINNEDYDAARQFKLRGEGKVYLVPGVGIDTRLFSPDAGVRKKVRAELDIKDDVFTLISAGDLIERKNYPVAIKALAKSGLNDFCYLICGSGNKEESLKELCMELGIGDKVRFLGRRSDVPELMKASDAFLFTTKQEGLPRSLMEAMASGLPCIASRIRGNTDLLEGQSGGLLCDVEDIEGFSVAIQRLATDTQLRKIYGANNVDTMKHYCVEAVEERIQHVYQEVFNSIAKLDRDNNRNESAVNV